MMESYEKLKAMVAAAEEDVRKAEGGNRAAATRARKAMQEIKSTAQSLRVELLGGKDEAESENPPQNPPAQA